MISLRCAACVKTLNRLPFPFYLSEQLLGEYFHSEKVWNFRFGKNGTQSNGERREERLVARKWTVISSGKERNAACRSAARGNIDSSLFRAILPGESEEI